jgi:hypothetical protein
MAYADPTQRRPANHAQDDEKNAKQTYFETIKRFVVPVGPLGPQIQSIFDRLINSHHLEGGKSRHSSFISAAFHINYVRVSHTMQGEKEGVQLGSISRVMHHDI